MTNKTDVSSKFKKFMSDDIMLKIVSLIIAVFLWFIVMNTINPTEVRNYPASIVFENASVLKEQGLTMVNEGDFEDTKINLRVEATRPALDELSKNNYKNNITAQVDLSKVELDDDLLSRHYRQLYILIPMMCLATILLMLKLKLIELTA